MSLYINTNSSAAYASCHLGRNHQSLQESLTRLSSGKRINTPADDSGGLAVSMKLESSINRLNGAERNLQNAVSFIEVQDGILEAAGRIVDRMIQLKGMSQDMMKNSFDNSTYNNEFRDLQMQLFDMTQQTFNGVSLFAQFNSEGGSGVFHAIPTDASRSFDNTVSIYTSSDGSAGPTISINKALLLSALTVNTGTLKSSIFSVGTTGNATATAGTASVVTFASDQISTAIDLTVISVGVLNQVLENIAGLRAQNGATQSRMSFASDNITKQVTNMEAAYGRIMDVDIAAESTRLAKFNVLKQASAAMLAQANTGSEIALMLLR
jgi:flagellin